MKSLVRTGMIVVGFVAVVYTVTVEARHWAANRRLAPSSPARSRAYLVLGCPPRPDGSLSPTQQWRVDLALRSWRPGDLLVISGAAMRGLPSEAVVMSIYAQQRGVPPADIVVESQARSTPENVMYALPWLRQASQVMVVSDPLHAARAIRFLRQRAPQVAGRVVQLPGYRFGEQPWRKTVSAAFESPAKPLVLAVHGWLKRRHSAPSTPPRRVAT